MYKKRQKQLLNEIKHDLNVDRALIMSPISIFYYTGFLADPHERFFALSLDVNTERAILFLPSLDESAAKEAAQVDEFVPVFDTENGYEKFKEKIGNPISFAFEKSYMTVAQYEQFTERFPNAVFKNIESFIESARLKKSREEIEHVNRAIAITEKGLLHTLENIQSGMTEQEIKALLEYELMNLGADGIAFDTIVLSGKNSALPHGAPGDREIQNGDFLLFDFGVTVNGYHSDLTRTFIVGEGTEEQKAIYETVCRANEKAIKAIKVGEPLKVIDQAARNYITAKHYGEYFTHRIGHGLGLEVHEQPSIHNENETLIQPGMLLTIEPGIYIPEIGGVRIEDDVYINKEGEIEVLSSFRKALTYISI